MSDEAGKVAATCRTCGRRLTVEEFRACRGRGHYCKAHLSNAVEKRRPTRRSRPRQPRAAGRGSGGRIAESSAVEYSCKAQFAADGVIRQGKLTADHPSCLDGDLVFVHKQVGYGPSEVATLFIADPQARRLAERSGYACHE